MKKLCLALALAVGLAFAALPAHATATLVQSKVFGNVNCSSCTSVAWPAFTSNITAGNFLLVFPDSSPTTPQGITSITDNVGDTFTACPGAFPAMASIWRTYCYYVAHAIGGATTITSHFASGAYTTYYWSAMTEWSFGTATASFDTAPVLSDTSGTSITTGTTPTVAGGDELIVAYTADGSGGDSYTAGTGYTLPASSSGQTCCSGGSAFEYKEDAAASGTYSPSFTHSGTESTLVIVVIKLTPSATRHRVIQPA